MLLGTRHDFGIWTLFCESGADVLPAYLRAYLLISLPAHLPACLPICLLACSFTCLLVHTPARHTYIKPATPIR